MIRITPRLSIDESELEESFVVASGPGGQNVNKVATAVQLRFNLAGNTSLPAPVKARLAALAGRRLGLDGTILISASRFRTQHRNREDARERLCAMIRDSEAAPLRRKPTRPTLASKTRRLEAKTHRAAAIRRRVTDD